jgi:tetratricopeptide (TPR) repeat protein
MRAFIVRPFGIQKDIDFDEVERMLIAPALKQIGAEGGTTIDILKSGNIREDMFRRLLTADLIVADLSIHNANVFYELGVRHALRDHGTFMLRCDADKFPFDLQTDRYFIYRKDDPAASLQALVEALRRTKEEIETNAAAKDSPVFAFLPNLREQDQTLFNPVPHDFGEEVARAAAGNQAGDLALLSYEVRGFEWELRGWRTVGTVQFDLKAFIGAKDTWESVRRLEPNDLEANLRLGTIYERLGDLTRSTQALERALANKNIKREERAETYSLLARNAKTRWRNEWESAPPEERPKMALRSPYLKDSFEAYEHAFTEDINHFYSGLNALAMLTIMIELADALPDVWNELFETDQESESELATHKERRTKLSAAVEVSLDATLKRMERERSKDVWAEISYADLHYITSKRPARVAAAYGRALAGAPEFARDSVRKQLALYKDLGVLGGNLAEVVKVVGEPQASPVASSQTVSRPQARVLLFAGHMIDAPGREKPRFPPYGELVAREKIKDAVVKEMNTGAGVVCAYAGGASGGDILFQEVCAELGITTRLYLAIPAPYYVTTSVASAGSQWIERFWTIHQEHSRRNQVRVLNEAAGFEIDNLPAWLRSKHDYSIWQRNNLWMLFNALDEGWDPKTGDPNLTLIALWDGKGGDGPGGTGDLVKKVENLGARCEIIKTKELFGL